MREATGDIIVTVEPDSTFRANDLDRLLIYGRDYDVVFGMRTSRTPVWSGGNPGADMYFMPGWGIGQSQSSLNIF